MPTIEASENQSFAADLPMANVRIARLRFGWPCSMHCHRHAVRSIGATRGAVHFARAGLLHRAHCRAVGAMGHVMH
jgi:hypothetical protein